MFVGCVAPFVEPLAAPACVALARVRAVTRGEPFFFRPFLLFLDPCSVWDTTLLSTRAATRASSTRVADSQARTVLGSLKACRGPQVRLRSRPPA